MKNFKEFINIDDNFVEEHDLEELLESEFELLNEGKIMTAFNTGIAIYITKMIITPWPKWKAYKLGLIDDKGKRTDKPATTQQEKEALSLINKFIISLRRILRFFLSEGILKILVATYITKNLLKK